MRVGYARVSTNEQNLDMQLDALKQAGCERIFQDIASGAKSKRTGLDEALSFVREGDTLVVWKLDRLGRSLKHLIDLINNLQEKGIYFKALQGEIDTTSINGKLVFHIFAALAEFERELIKERTQAGLAAARARGRKGGRPSKLSTAQMKQLKALYESKNTNIDEICSTFSITKPTLYRYIEKAKEMDL